MRARKQGNSEGSDRKGKEDRLKEWTLEDLQPLKHKEQANLRQQL